MEFVIDEVIEIDHLRPRRLRYLSMSRAASRGSAGWLNCEGDEFFGKSYETKSVSFNC